jgi:hypothetical protein
LKPCENMSLLWSWYMSVIGPTDVKEHTIDTDFEYTCDLYQTHSFAAVVTVWRQCKTLSLPPVNITHTHTHTICASVTSYSKNKIRKE